MTITDRDIRENDTRTVNLFVDCAFRWNDKIPVMNPEGGIDYYTKGWEMYVLPNQKQIFNGEEHFLKSQAVREIKD